MTMNEKEEVGKEREKGEEKYHLQAWRSQQNVWEAKWKKEEMGQKGREYERRDPNGVLHFGLWKTKTK